MKKDKFIVSKTPLRISFAGGGSDLPAYFDHSTSEGKVVSTAIDKFVYVTVKSHGPTFDERIRLNYYETETANSPTELKNNIIKSCLQYLNITDRIYISSISDIQAGTGLGSSSSFTVGLLNCLHRFRGDEQLSAFELAEEAVKIELDLVGSPIGLQDQFGCAIGGLKKITFGKGRRVQLERLESSMSDLKVIFDDILLMWTGNTRSANDILESQSKSTSTKMNDIQQMVDLATKLEKSTKDDFNSKILGKILHDGWMLKKTLSSKISHSKIDQYYDLALKNGAYGGKVLGAGGGGFLLLVAPKDQHSKIERALVDFQKVTIAPESQDTKIIASNY